MINYCYICCVMAQNWPHVLLYGKGDGDHAKGDTCVVSPLAWCIYMCFCVYMCVCLCVCMLCQMRGEM